MNIGIGKNKTLPRKGMWPQNPQGQQFLIKLLRKETFTKVTGALVTVARAVNYPSENSTSSKYQICTKTVMDTSDPDIQFDQEGICNYWHEFHQVRARQPDGEELKRILDKQLAIVKAIGKNKDYDCILGLSGGVDSSYLALIAKKFGLRPLIVHFDNGWNTEAAVRNIREIVTRLKFDLHTFVMDWPQFRDLQRSYFLASVLDLEVPTDHMILGALYQTARKFGIKVILSGNNFASEWLLPKAWYYNKFDLTNLKNIHRAFGSTELRKLPSLGVWKRAIYTLGYRISDISLLNLIEYNKISAIEELSATVGWKDYGGKHHESIFTRFYQGHILPLKFGIDKRRAHLSNLICAGQLQREAAIVEMNRPPYSEAQQHEDKSYVARKLGFSDEEFEKILNLPNRSHEDYGTDHKQREIYMKTMKILKPVTRFVRRYWK